MNTKIIQNHIYRSRNGAIHKVLTIDVDETTTADMRPVITVLLAGDPMTGRTFTEYGFELYDAPGKPQRQSPGDLIEDITGTPEAIALTATGDAGVPSTAPITPASQIRNPQSEIPNPIAPDAAPIPAWVTPTAIAGAILVAILAIYLLSK